MPTFDPMRSKSSGGNRFELPDYIGEQDPSDTRRAALVLTGAAIKTGATRVELKMVLGAIGCTISED